jgi:hypothetical protein
MTFDRRDPPDVVQVAQTSRACRQRLADFVLLFDGGPPRVRCNMQTCLRCQRRLALSAFSRVSGGRCRGNIHAGATNSPKLEVFDIPPGPEQATKQVQQAIRTAYDNGKQRQIVNALIPLIGATDLDDWCASYALIFPGYSRLQVQRSVNKRLVVCVPAER